MGVYLPHARINGVENVPCFAAGYAARVDASQIALGIRNTEDEEAEDGGNHECCFQPEEPAISDEYASVSAKGVRKVRFFDLPSQLVRTQSAEGEMHQPEEEEGEHSSTSDTHAGGNMVGNVFIETAKDASEHD